MIERIVDYPGYLIRFPSSAIESNAVLFLHGFPANRNVKNLDLADVVHQQTKRAVYLLHYRGLGESHGDFRFTQSIQEAVEVMHRLAKDHRKVTVIGHSWGGLVGMNIAQRCPELVDQLILLSPLCELDKNNSLYSWILHEVKNDCPGVYGKLSQEDILAEIEGVVANHAPKDIVGRIPSTIPITLIQAALDDTTPAAAAKALLPHFSSQVNYLELPQDHSFSQSRRQLADTILGVLR